jgi:hypothetical protein
VLDTLQGGGHAAASSTGRLSAILNEIGASEFLQNFIDDDQDDDCIASYKIPSRVRRSYGLPQHLAASFVEKCRLSVGAQRSAAASISDFPSTSTTTSSASSSPAPASAATPVDAASLLRKLNLEMVGELGKGGFGTVYKCKDALQKRFVAVKLVNDAKNAQAAMREGQKLLRAKHKNIVQVHLCSTSTPSSATSPALWRWRWLQAATCLSISKLPAVGRSSVFLQPPCSASLGSCWTLLFTCTAG